jgi:hypothetical protein
MQVLNRDDIEPFLSNDKSIIRELASPATALPRSGSRRAPLDRSIITPGPERCALSSTARRGASDRAMS